MQFSFDTIVNKKSISSLAFAFIAALSITSIASAATLSASLDSRGSFVYPSGTPNASSYDGPGFDTMSVFSPFTTSNLLQVTNFTGHTNGSHLEAFLLSEMAAFDGSNAGSANNFGVVNGSGQFTSMLDTKNVDPLAVGALDQTASDDFTFALQSPEGLFYSVDSKNTDGQVAHMLALQVDKDGTVNLPFSNVRGTNPVSFSLLSGDIIFFIEDMRLSGNVSSGLVPFASDFDYNDMIVVVRQSALAATAVPEPASLLLLGSAIFGLNRKRKAA